MAEITAGTKIMGGHIELLLIWTKAHGLPWAFLLNAQFPGKNQRATPELVP